jgi:hypothetical protein
VDQQSFQSRLKLTENVTVRRLMELMVAKQTNLCIALDFQHSSVLLQMARKVSKSCSVVKIITYTPGRAATLYFITFSFFGYLNCFSL